MKKPFKDTKFGKLLNEKLPDAVAVVGDVLPDKGVLGVVKNIIDASTLTTEEKAELKAEAHNYELELIKIDADDKKDARAMNVALNLSEQASLLAKNIAPIIALLVIVVTLGLYFYCVAFGITHFREEIRELRDLCILILGYYFGSSFGSKAKDHIINELKK